jgi:hypothetical protein
MIKDEATPHVIDMVKNFVSLLRQIEPQWKKAYLRFYSQDSVREIKGSYAHETGVVIIDSIKNKSFFNPAIDKCQEVLKSLGKAHGLFLLSVDQNLKYRIECKRVAWARGWAHARV